jgi:hypothetical protein
MSKIQIICSSPGMRRHGVKHPASAIYDAGHWTDDQLKAFDADPAFTVLKVAEGGVQIEGGDIEAAVAARVTIAAEELQAKFNKAVEDKVAEKIADAKAEAVKDLQTQLSAANGKVEELTVSVSTLTAALDEAKAKAPPKK